MTSENGLLEVPNGPCAVRSGTNEKPCCKLCGSGLVEPLYQREPGWEFATRIPAGSSIPATGHTIVRCLVCGMSFAFSPGSQANPSGDQVQLYDDKYYTLRWLTGRMDDVVSKKQMPPSQRQVRGCVKRDKQLLQYLEGVLTRVRTSKDMPIRYLDVGCGCGESLSAARELGWSGVGVDIAKPAIDFGQKVLGLDIRAGLLEEVDFPQSSFDIVILREVLEHSPKPAELLKEIHRLLSPSGVLYVQVPNDLAGYRARIFSKAWHLIPPVHLQYFTLLSLTTMLAMNGFAAYSHGTLGGIGRDLLRYMFWRSGLLGAFDGAYYRAGLSLAVRAMYRAVFELFRPLDRYFDSRGLGSNLWVCVRKI